MESWKYVMEMEIFLSARTESLGQQSETAASTEPQCEASCSGAVRTQSAPSLVVGSFEEGAVAPAATERSEPEGTEDTSGGCRRAEPTTEKAEEAKSQAARGNQDFDDSDDDPILIPPTRFRGQGQRYVRKHPFECGSFSLRIRCRLFLIYKKHFLSCLFTANLD